MGNDQHVAGLGGGADLLRGGDAAHGAHVRAHVLGRPPAHEHLKLTEVYKALAGGDGHRNLVGDLGHGVDVVGGHGVLQHHGPVFGHLVAEGHGLGGGHAPVGLQDQVKVGADGLADDPHLLQLVLDAAGVKLVMAVLLALDGAVDEDLGGGKAHGLQLSVVLRQALQVVLLAHDRGVDPDLLPGPAAQQLVDRHAQGLALDVPEGDVDGGDGGHDDAAPKVDGAVEVLIQILDAEGVLPDQVLPEFQNGGGGGLQIAPVARLAQAHDARVRVHVAEQIVLGVDQLDVGDFHGSAPF